MCIRDRDLNDGDIIIMITDGILDANKEAIDKQQSLEEFIRQINTRQSTKNCGYSSTRGYRPVSYTHLMQKK